MYERTTLQNPTPTVDAIIQKNSQILLVKRKKEPFKGYLVLLSGFVNEGERVEDAAKREIKEETSLDIELLISLVFTRSLREIQEDILCLQCLLERSLKVLTKQMRRTG